MATLITTATQIVETTLKEDVDFQAFSIRADVKAIHLPNGGTLDGHTFQPGTYAVATDKGYVEFPAALFQALYAAQ